MTANTKNATTTATTKPAASLHPLLRPGQTVEDFFTERRRLNDRMRMVSFRQEQRRRQGA
jgi:hypothetical protein